MKISRYLPIVILICVGLAFATADAQENLAQEVSAIFQQNCWNCHGPSGSHKDALLIERTALVDSKVVIPGNPESSEFYKRLLGPTENGPQMPLNLPPLSPEAIETIASWITAGAPDWNVQRDINFITTDAMLGTIQTHLKSLDPFDRPSARYFTMTHLYNAGESPETLSDYRIALSKLVNSLSWKFEITNPTPIDAAQTIFHIDLRRYEWNTTTDAWTLIEQTYPYNIEFDPETQAGLLEKLTQLQTETDSTVPFVHVDWFLATASLPPLYHDILGLPQTDRLLETQLEVNVESNIRNAPGIDVWRAGFNDSGVSSNNRVVERHTSRYGAYWKSYDFAGSVGSQNIFTHPLDFTHDGGEIIFNLPNGLQAYLLVDANGVRLNDAPIKIVSNPAASDPTVRNGLSCIGCHTQGMKTFEDSVRAAIEQDDNPPYNKEQALRLYPEQSVLDELLQKDTLRFQQALEKIGGPFADDASRERFFKRHENEPVQRFHEAFQAPLDASHAAAAVGLETEAFLTQISEKQSLKNLGLQTLIDVNGTVKRDAWTSNFDQVISALNTPDSVLPPVVQRPERIPGETVDIPDPNLRATIAEALGKASADTITVEDMMTLKALKAEKKEISDLTSIQFAQNLEVLNISGNPISDLSPLAGLTALKELSVNWTLLSDLSPLAGLVNLQNLRAWSKNNTVSDLSPLANLTKLTSLDISGSRGITDIHPLAKLTNLEYLRLYDNAITDIMPLEGLIHLKDLFVEANHTVLDLAPLVNLKGLKFLQLANNKISDVSPLSGLTALENLYLNYNNIKDIGPLASLSNLTKLWLQGNSISNISSLAELTNLEELNLTDNPITDFSLLAALAETTNILTGEVAIPDPNLRAAIAEALGKEHAAIVSITAEEMATLTDLSAENKGIRDLTGLESAINLVGLYASDNQISDLSPLAGLTQLTNLGLYRNNVSDISPLVGLTKLERLLINGDNNNPGPNTNYISDISPLTELTQLKWLKLSYNNISDLSPLAGLTQLTDLSLNGNNILDFSPLVGLTKLENLSFDVAYENLSMLPESIAKLQESLYFSQHEPPISDLSPLAKFTGLEILNLRGNNISDLSPLAALMKLSTLGLDNNNISDLSPLAELTELQHLSLDDNNISDLSPLAELTELGSLNLHGNNISDFSPLTELTKLRVLDLTRNNISDMSPLAAVLENTSNVLLYDNPGFPEGGPPIEGPYLWVGVPALADEWKRQGVDLMAEASGNAVTELEIATNGASEGSLVGENVWTAHKVEKRHKVGASLAAIGMEGAIVYGCIFVDSPRHQETTLFIPDGYRIKVWLNGVLVHHSWRSRSGPPDYDYFSPVTLKAGKNVLLFGVSNGGDSFGTFGFAPGTEYTASIRGMEYTLSDPAIYIGDTFALDLSARNVIDLAGWQFDIGFDPEALEAVEVNEGDFLKTDGGTTFFQSGTIDNTTGKITGLNATRFNEDGATGTGTLLSVTFLAKAKGETQLTLNNFQLGSTTGEPIAVASPEVVITIEGQLTTGDVNRDGQVSVLDLILVSRHLGEDASANPQADVNNDGVINIQDLIVVAQHLGESTDAAAPSIIAAINNGELTPALIQTWIERAQAADDGSLAFRQGIANLEHLLTLFIPDETALLHNYPNPFNPETWIPYQLAEPAEVTLTIHAVNGTLVRTLALGYQPAGIYQTHSRAAYWDGKNEVGEPVASGIYFYTLTAGDFNATRKMLIKK